MDMSQSDSFPVITLRDVMNIVFRYKILIITMFLVFSILSYLYVSFQPDIYVSEAKLLLTVGRENIEMIPTGDNAVSVSRSLVQDINAEIEIFRSPELYEKLFDDLNMESFLFDQKLVSPEISTSSPQFAKIREQVVIGFQGDIQIDVARNSNVIVISYGSQDPEFAYNTVSRLIDIYMDKRTDIHYSSGSYNFFSEQSNKYLSALNDIEKELAGIKNDLNITSVEDYRTALMTRVETIHSELDLNNAALAESQSQIQMIQTELAQFPAISSGNALNYETLLDELMTLQTQERELQFRYTDDNIQVQSVRQRIEDIGTRLQDIASVDSPSSAALLIQQDLMTRQIQLAGLKARNTELQNTLEHNRDDLLQLNETELSINQLERERKIQYDNYMKYSDNLEEARIDTIVQQEKLSNIRVLQSATEPLTPIAQRKFRDLVLGMFLGLFGGIGIALVLDYMDHTIKTPEDIEKRLRLQTLTSIPFNGNRKDIEAATHLLLNGQKVG